MGDSSFSFMDEKKRSSTPDVLKSRIRQSTDLAVADEDDSEEGTLHQSDQSPVVSHAPFFFIYFKLKSLTNKPFFNKCLLNTKSWNISIS